MDFTHLNAAGDPQMVDVSAKAVTTRTAVAQSVVQLPPAVVAQLENDDIHTKKGPVFQTAILAGIMAAKRTSELIPLCHPLPLSKCSVDIRVNEAQEVVIECLVKTTSRTGVEMEALTGASVAALTIYDMCKGFSHDIVISSTQLLQKTGGKSDVDRRATQL